MQKCGLQLSFVDGELNDHDYQSEQCNELICTHGCPASIPVKDGSARTASPLQEAASFPLYKL